MPLFPASFIEDLKSHVDIVQVVQERVPLRQSGRDLERAVSRFMARRRRRFT